MTPIVGNEAAQAAFTTAAASGALHHAWLIVGPQGVGKATFARNAATRLLAEAASVFGDSGDRIRSLIEAGAHPDYREMVRLPRDAAKPEQGVARSITITQVRALQPMFATTPSMSPRRVVVIDAVDDLERAGANALLKNLEEPPAGTIFLLVSHVPGRLLPTIRSRCRLLRFAALDDARVAAVVRAALPEAKDAEVAALVSAADGAPGRALGYAGLGIDAIDGAMAAIARSGDRDNAGRVALARMLGGKAAQPRYEAFLDRAPSVAAAIARTRSGVGLKLALDIQARAGELAGAARGLSLDPQATVFEMAGLLARLAEPTA